MNIKKIRDLTFIQQEKEKALVIACDSCGAVGNKPMDQVKVSPEVVGYFTTRVSLMEVLSVGANILTVINTLGVEMEPTGSRVIEGIKQLLEEASIDVTCINGSTEENFTTCETSIGVTVIGEVKKENCKVNRSSPGDLILALGVPKVGNEILFPRDEEICSLESFMRLISCKEVKEIIPVGSKGILYEAELLANLNGGSFMVLKDVAVDLLKSAGPATTVIFSIAPKDIEKVQGKLSQPIHVIGTLA